MYGRPIGIRMTGRAVRVPLVLVRAERGHGDLAIKMRHSSFAALEVNSHIVWIYRIFVHKKHGPFTPGVFHRVSSDQRVASIVVQVRRGRK